MSGILDFEGSRSDNTNASLLVDPRFARLGPYVSEPRVFKCPSDASQVRPGGRRTARVRSVAMNQAVGAGGTEDWVVPNAGWRSYRSTTDMVQPAPVELWVFVEEHPDSIDDGSFTVDLASQGMAGYFYSWPANYHGDGANFAFADGHTERHEWRDARTRHENMY